MISHMPTKIVILLAATIVFSGCAVKPRKASRFQHSVSADGTCNCYTCRNCGDYVEESPVIMSDSNVTMSHEMGSFPPAQPSSNSFAPTAPTEPISIQSRPLYEVPETLTPAPTVSAEMFDSQSPSLIDTDQPVINEVQPEEDGLKLNSMDEPMVEPGGGSFKPMKAREEVVKQVPEIKETKTVDTPKIVEPTPAKLAPIEPAPIKSAPIEPAPIEPAPVKPTPVAPKIVEPTPVIPPVKDIVEPIKVPKPKSTFKPGEAFKPRKRVKPIDSSSWHSPKSMFKSATVEKVEIAMAPEPLAVPVQAVPVQVTPVQVTPVQDPVDTFFDRNEFAPAAKPLRQQQPGEKIVLRANPVERSVVYVPPMKSVSQVVVPALRAGFRKKAADGNWLRELPTQQVPVPASQIADVRSYETTASAGIVQQIPQPQPQPMQVAEAVQPQIQKIPVRLRAIPMNERMIKGKQVEVRFREHVPTPENAPQRQAQTTNSQRLLTQSTDIPALLANELTLPSSNEVDLEFATPAAADSTFEHTARAVETEVATPPWRIK